MFPLENYEVTFTFTITYFLLSSMSGPNSPLTIYSIDVKD